MPKRRPLSQDRMMPTAWVPLLGGLLFLGALLLTFWQKALNERDMYWVLLQMEQRISSMEERLDATEGRWQSLEKTSVTTSSTELVTETDEHVH